MSKFRVNQKVYFPSIDKKGIVRKVDMYGQPQTAEIDGVIVDVLNLVVIAIPLFKRLWLLIKYIFRKNE